MKLENDMYVKCNSEEEAREFIKIAYEQGWKWEGNNTYEVTCWEKTIGNHIVYHLWYDKTIGWFNLPIYTDKNIIEYSDLKNKIIEQMEENKLVNKKIFIINGSGGVGKDTFVKTVGKFIDAKNYSSVQPIKDVTKLLGWEGGKTEKDRKFLSDLKLLVDKYNCFIYQNNILRQIQEFINDEENIALFLHMREPLDIKNIINAYNTIINYKSQYKPITTILVKRDNIEDIKSNIADAGVDDYEYDFIVDNNRTLLELKNTAIQLIDEYVL